ncbi:hypothetical protein LXL04_017420 [Taraxacum kok-saghyz]
MPTCFGFRLIGSQSDWFTGSNRQSDWFTGSNRHPWFKFGEPNQRSYDCNREIDCNYLSTLHLCLHFLTVIEKLTVITCNPYRNWGKSTPPSSYESSTLVFVLRTAIQFTGSIVLQWLSEQLVAEIGGSGSGEKVVCSATGAVETLKLRVSSSWSRRKSQMILPITRKWFFPEVPNDSPIPIDLVREFDERGFSRLRSRIEGKQGRM